MHVFCKPSFKEVLIILALKEMNTPSEDIIQSCVYFSQILQATYCKWGKKLWCVFFLTSSLKGKYKHTVKFSPILLWVTTFMTSCLLFPFGKGVFSEKKNSCSTSAHSYLSFDHNVLYKHVRQNHIRQSCLPFKNALLHVRVVIA